MADRLDEKRFPGEWLPSRADLDRAVGARPVRLRHRTLHLDIFNTEGLQLVTEVASAHMGTVKDFEGDGALLYFASMKNAVNAALAIRRRLADGRCNIACGDGPGITARMSVTVGEVVVGVVGSSTRHGMALIGPSVNIGARLLKHAPLGAIIASGEVFEELQRDAPRLAEEFHQLDAAFVIPGADGMTVATYVASPLPAAAAIPEEFHCSPAS